MRPKRVLIIGGYGNFGSYIAQSLAGDDKIVLLIGGRSLAKAIKFIQNLEAINKPEPVFMDIDGDILSSLRLCRPDIVIHTTGPFQTQDYRVAKACITQRCHYLDLADARKFVVGFNALDAIARKAKISAITGASSVPCFSAAVVDEYLPEFKRLTTIQYGISAAQQTNRGLATTSAVLSYVGKPIRVLSKGRWRNVIGWQDFHAVNYPELGSRFFGNCEIPDLDLFPRRYLTLRNVQFSAGHELKILHVATWALSWLVRWGVVRSLSDHASLLLKLAFLFDWLGSAKSGFHMIMQGAGRDGKPLEKRFYIIAKQGHGPYIPCMPAIILAKRLARGRLKAVGAKACLDLIDLEEYLAALKGLDIKVARV